VHERLWWENFGEKNLEDLSVDGRILLKWIFEQFNGRNTVAQDRHSGELL
jgi:hypothetical protein